MSRERCFECGGTGRCSWSMELPDLVNGPDDPNERTCEVCGGKGWNEDPR